MWYVSPHTFVLTASEYVETYISDNTFVSYSNGSQYQRHPTLNGSETWINQDALPKCQSYSSASHSEQAINPGKDMVE